MGMEGRVVQTDYLIIGGGSAGCVMAGRLSEDPAYRVILIEAGPDAQPAEVRTGRFLTYNRAPYYWDMADERGPYNQPRIIGGGSALNAMHAQRGLPSDYDEWAQLGVRDWSYDDVRPHFEALESDPLDAGTHGPVSLNRVSKPGLSGLSKALSLVLPAYGIPELNNVNTEAGDGFGAVPLTFRNGNRVSSADAFLTPAARTRPNLSILSGHKAIRLLFDGKRIVGAEIKGPGGSFHIAAGETILCCGGILSPTLLLRSGIGPAAELLNIGIEPRVDRPGVGKNLQNHPMFFVGAYLTAQGRQPRDAIHPCPYVVRYSSNDPGCPPTDMLLNVWERIPGRLAWDPAGRQMAILNLIVNKVYSRGSVSLTSDAADAPPSIQFNFLQDKRDLDRMVGGVHFLCRLLAEDAVRSAVDIAFAPVWKPLAITMMGHGAKAQALSIAGAIALSGPSGLRRRLLKDMGPELNELEGQGDTDIGQFVKTYMLPSYHVSGTCRMGDPSQPETVVDSSGSVVGVSALRVVDASIFPTLMAAGLNLPVMMAAQKVSQAIIAARREAA
jgi:5-(hydroxymethyl)furfural/furfural oxidase